MNTDFYLSELFDRYLENDLNIIERQEFELRLKNDRMFAEQFRLHKEIDQALIQDDVLDFRKKLRLIGANNQELVKAPPMVISEELNPEIDQAILEQDIIALRNQLNRIHAAVVEEVDHHEIEGYSGIERAIINQDSLALNEELSAFDEFILNPDDLHDGELAELSLEVDRAIIQDDVMQLRKTLDGIARKSVSSAKVVPLKRKTVGYVSVAAAAIFLLVFAGNFFLNQNFGTSSPDRLVHKYFTAYDGLAPKRGITDEDRLFEQGLQKYNNGDYTNALEWFEASLDEGKSGPVETSQLYAGMSAFLLGKYDLALSHLSKIDSNSLSNEQVDWYTAGSYVGKGEFDKAKAILTKIAEDPEHQYYKDSQALLESLKNR